MLDPAAFAPGSEPLKRIAQDLGTLMRRMKLEPNGTFEPRLRRPVVFLDTPDHLLFGSGMILRQRGSRNGRVELTLKAMSPDRYIASAADVRTTLRVQVETKF